VKQRAALNAGARPWGSMRGIGPSALVLLMSPFKGVDRPSQAFAPASAGWRVLAGGTPDVEGRLP